MSVPRLIFSLLLDFPESGKNLGKSGQTCKIRLALKKNLEGVRQNPENLAQVHSFLAENAENEVSQSILKFGVDNPILFVMVFKGPFSGRATNIGSLRAIRTR